MTIDPDEEATRTARAEAALDLVESLMRALLDEGVMSKAGLLEAVESTISAKRQLAREGGEPAVASRAAGILATVANSLAATSPPRRGRRRTNRRRDSSK